MYIYVGDMAAMSILHYVLIYIYIYMGDMAAIFIIHCIMIYIYTYTYIYINM